MRVDVARHVLAHDQRVPERAEIRLQVGDGTFGRRVGQMKRQVPIQGDGER